MYRICIPNGHLLAVVEERNGEDVILATFEDTATGYNAAYQFMLKLRFPWVRFSAYVLNTWDHEDPRDKGTDAYVDGLIGNALRAVRLDEPRY